MRRWLALTLAPLALVSGTALADPGYYVVTVYDDPGARSVDFRYWVVRSPGDGAVAWPEIGLAWNPTGRWYTEVLASYVGGYDFPTRLSTLNWQNDYLLTQGQYPLDLALHTLLVRPQNPAAGGALEFGPALQTDVGRTQLNFNLVFERSFGSTATDPTQLKYQWQVRHRWRPGLHFGAQGFGELGPWKHWSPRGEQSHRAGPALFGQVPLGAQSLSWQAAYLSGSTYATHGSMFTMRVKLDF
jgi:hypothetical protein